MVDLAEQWRWSSAASHVAGKRAAGDPLTDVAALGRHVRNWRAMLRLGLEAGDVAAGGEAVAQAIEARLSTGRPLAEDVWIVAHERAMQRPLARQRPGPKPRSRQAIAS